LPPSSRKQSKSCVCGKSGTDTVRQKAETGVLSEPIGLKKMTKEYKSLRKLRTLKLCVTKWKTRPCRGPEALSGPRKNLGQQIKLN
jgi:hypothetical protein